MAKVTDKMSIEDRLEVIEVRLGVLDTTLKVYAKQLGRANNEVDAVQRLAADMADTLQEHGDSLRAIKGTLEEIRGKNEKAASVYLS